MPLARTLIREALEVDGYACRVAESDADAASVVEREGIDGMIFSLPVAGGVGVTWLEQVSRRWPRLIRRTVVTASAELGADDRRRIASIGAVLLLRPFSVVTLLSIVSDMMASSIGPM